MSSGDSNNLKALYRRGQAYSGLQKWRKAAADLQGAHQLSKHDPPQHDLIGAKLALAKAQLAENPDADLEEAEGDVKATAGRIG